MRYSRTLPDLPSAARYFWSYEYYDSYPHALKTLNLILWDRRDDSMATWVHLLLSTGCSLRRKKTIGLDLNMLEMETSWNVKLARTWSLRALLSLLKKRRRTASCSTRPRTSSPPALSTTTPCSTVFQVLRCWSTLRACLSTVPRIPPVQLSSETPSSAFSAHRIPTRIQSVQPSSDKLIPAQPVLQFSKGTHFKAHHSRTDLRFTVPPYRGEPERAPQWTFSIGETNLSENSSAALTHSPCTRELLRTGERAHWETHRTAA